MNVRKQGDTQFQGSYSALRKENNYVRYLGIYTDLDVPYAQIQIDKMTVLDYLLENYDRHWRNFGFIRDVNSLEQIKKNVLKK